LNTKRDGRQGKFIRIYCKDCKKKVTINYKAKKENELLKEHLNRKSYRMLEDENGCSAKTICSLTNTVTSQLIHANELTAILKPGNYSGVILADGKYIPVKDIEQVNIPEGHIPKSKKRRGKTKKGITVIPFMDYLTHDIPVYITALSENMLDLERGFYQLKKLNYPLKVLVCDESMGETAQVAEKVFPDVIVQTCLKHYSACIEREFKINGVKRTIKAIENKLDKLNESFFIPTRHHDRKKAIEYTNRIADLEFEYSYLITLQSMFQEIFWGTETEETLTEIENQLNEFISHIDLNTYPYADKIQKRYLDYYSKWDRITAFIRYPELNIPNSTNLIEGFNSTTAEMRIGSIRGFETEETAMNYINAMILKYRFHKFKCCRGKFKHLNKKSPLEISEPLHNLKNLSSKDWVELCRKLKK